MIKKMTAYHGRLSLLLILIAALAVPSTALTSDDFQQWTTVASAGTVDPQDLNQVEFLNGSAYLRATAPVGAEAVIRYNLLRAKNGLRGNNPNAPVLMVRFRDNGADARVIVHLKAYDKDSGETTTLGTFDSDRYTPSAGFQTQSIGGCPIPGRLFTPIGSIDDPSKAYFIEAHLIKVGHHGRPGLGIIEYVDYPHLC